MPKQVSFLPNRHRSSDQVAGNNESFSAQWEMLSSAAPFACRMWVCLHKPHISAHRVPEGQLLQDKQGLCTCAAAARVVVAAQQ